MANIELLIDKSKAERYNYKDLASAINYYSTWYFKNYADKVPLPFFKNGMPQKFPNGKYGYVLAGLSGLHSRPEPKRGDHRLSYRYREIPVYTQEYGNFQRFTIPYTVYEDDLRVLNEKPEYFLTLQLKQLNNVFPMYMDYLTAKILGGSLDGNNLGDWVKKYIEPSNGSNDGYDFYLNNGYAAINLSEVITKQKKTEHPLKTKLEAINTQLKKNEHKLEYDYTNDNDLKNKKYIKDNFISDSCKKFIGLSFKIRSEINEIIRLGQFDKKYKVKSQSWEGYSVPVSRSDLVLIISMKDKNEFEVQSSFIATGHVGFKPNSD